MKKLTTLKGVFGPYKEVEVLSDRYRADGADLPFTVVGEGTISEAQPEDFPAPVVPTPVPASVTPRQIRQAMTAAGLRASVEAAIAAADQDTKDWYEFATEFRRDHAMVAALASALSVTEQQLDDLWTLAASL